MAEARRIVVKVGSSSLTTAAGGLDADRVDALVDVARQGCTASGRRAAKEVVLVSSGAIAAGPRPARAGRRPRDLARQQAAASVGQGLLVARYTASFARYGVRVGQVLLTSDDISRRAHYRNAYRTLDKLLAMGALPVVNENDTVATDEIRFGDNDRLAALVAHLVRADLLVLLSDVDGLYDGDPSTPGTSRIAEVHGPAGPRRASTSAARARPGVGTGGMVTKVEAARIAAGGRHPRRAHLRRPRRRRPGRAAPPAPTSTATGKRSADRLLWLAARLHPAAARSPWTTARCGRSSSGAPRCCRPGIAAVEGEFTAGRPGRAARQRGPRGGPRAGQLRRQGDPAAARPLDPRTGARSWAPRTSARSCTGTTWSPAPADRPNARSVAETFAQNRPDRAGLVNSAAETCRTAAGRPCRRTAARPRPDATSPRAAPDAARGAHRARRPSARRGRPGGSVVARRGAPAQRTAARARR